MKHNDCLFCCSGHLCWFIQPTTEQFACLALNDDIAKHCYLTAGHTERSPLGFLLSPRSRFLVDFAWTLVNLCVIHFTLCVWTDLKGDNTQNRWMLAFSDMSLRICQGISVYFIVTCFLGSLGAEYNKTSNVHSYLAFPVIYKAPQILSVLNHEALKKRF